jgi:tight adherence protein B
MQVLLLYALVAISVLMAAEAGLLLARGNPASRMRRIRARLRRHSSRLTDADAGSIVLERSNTLLGRFTLRLSRRRDLELFLYRAAVPISVTQFVTLIAGLAIGGFCATGFFTRSIPIGLAGALLPAALPVGYVTLRKRARMKAFEAQMPEALDLICRALRAGISLEFGLRSVGDELPDPIGTEFGHVADEVSLGLDTRSALNNLAARVNTSDMPFLVNAIVIQRETGGNLAEILDNLSRIIRDRIKFYGKVKSLVAQVNLSANLLALMPLVFAGGMSLVSPGYLDPLFEGKGLYFLYGSAIAVPVGWLACKRIASIDM